MSSLLTEENVQEKKKIAWAVLFSVLVHLLLIVAAVIFLIAQKRWSFKPDEHSAPVEMVLMPPPVQNAEPTFVNTTDDQKTEKAPEDKTFESDKNTQAATQAPAEGNLPVPSQEGREGKIPEFQDQNHTEGTEARQSAPPSQPSQAQKAQEAEPEQKEEQPKQDHPMETPPNSVALLEPPVNKTAREMKPVKEKHQEERPQTPASRPGYQPETRTTRIRGNINNRGRTSLSAVSTPLGRYKKMLSDAIGSRWYYYVEQQMGMLSIGTVEIHFTVSPDGSVHGPRVVSNSSNESFASCSLRSIMDAKIPPIPEDVAPSLEKGGLEVDYSFSIMNN